MALGQAEIRLPDSSIAPKHPLPKPDKGRYHLVRFIRGDAVLDVFGEKFRLPPELLTICDSVHRCGSTKA